MPRPRRKMTSQIFVSQALGASPREIEKMIFAILTPDFSPFPETKFPHIPASFEPGVFDGWHFPPNQREWYTSLFFCIWSVLLLPNREEAGKSRWRRIEKTSQVAGGGGATPCLNSFLQLYRFECVLWWNLKVISVWRFLVHEVIVKGPASSPGCIGG